MTNECLQNLYLGDRDIQIDNLYYPNLLFFEPGPGGIAKPRRAKVDNQTRWLALTASFGPLTHPQQSRQTTGLANGQTTDPLTRERERERKRWPTEVVPIRWSLPTTSLESQLLRSARHVCRALQFGSPSNAVPEKEGRSLFWMGELPSRVPRLGLPRRKEKKKKKEKLTD